MLVPTIGRAREHANAIACTSNLRQWGAAEQLYWLANGGCLPRRGQGVQATNQITRATDWFNALPPLLQMQSYKDMAAAGQIPRPGGSSSIWICPSAVDFSGPNYWSYGMNMGLSVWEGNQNGGRADSVDNIGNTSVLVFLADAPGNYCSVFPSKSAGGYNPVARHGGAVNICFVDGHVAPFSASYLGIGVGMIEHPDVRWHPPKSTWNSAK